MTQAQILEYLPILLSISVFGAVFLFAYAGLDVFLEAARKKAEFDRAEGGVPVSSFMDVATTEQTIFLTVLGMFLCGGGAFVLSGSYLSIVLGVAIGLLLPQLVIAVQRSKLRAKFESQLVDALTTMSNSLKAGYSLIQAFELVSKEMSPPISREFAMVIKENQLGVHLDKALSNLCRRVQSTNVDLVVNSITIVRQAGGNLAEVFDTIAETIRERTRLEGKIDAMTAQGRLQGIVLASMPILFGMAFNWLQPGVFKVLFTTTMGYAALTIVFFLYAIAGFFIYKIVNVKI